MATKRRDCFNEINITPLTDIFLVLLIIMMVIAPLLDQQGLNLVVPDNVEMEQIKGTKTISITVTAEGQYICEDQEIAASDLEKFIKDSVKSYPDGLTIQADAEAEHGVVVKLMDKARNAGVTSITVGAA